jgi:hypothetical protein
MDPHMSIDVTMLDAAHRRALEDVLGQELRTDQRLTISVTKADDSQSSHQSKQSLDDWAKVYEGLTDQQIEDITRDVTTRANLTRDVS